MRTSTFFLAAVLASVSFAKAATVYSSGASGPATGSYYSDPSASQILAARFSISTGVSITSIRVEGSYAGGPLVDDHFSIAVMADNSGGVGAVVGSYVFSDVPVTRAFLGGVADFYEYDLVPATTIDLPAGDYWFSVMNQPVGTRWGWAYSGISNATMAVSNTSQTSGYGGPLNASPVYFSFEGTVPEPSALMLGGLGAGLILLRKRR
jgi:hypothetical protein